MITSFISWQISIDPLPTTYYLLPTTYYPLPTTYYLLPTYMALPRIKVAKDKAELVQKLLDTKGTTGMFATYADIIAFAATLGAKYQQRSPLREISQSEPAPISLEVFISRGYDHLIKLIAVMSTEDIKVLSNEDATAEAARVLIFEEYANGGLSKLQHELRGAVDYTERLVLILNTERFSPEANDEEFDLSRFL